MPVLLGLPLLLICLGFTGLVLYLKSTLGFQLNVIAWCIWPLLVTVSLCCLLSWKAGPVFKPACLVISRFGVELAEGRKSFQLRWDELGDPMIRAVRGQSFIIFGQCYSMGGVIDPILPRIENVFELSLPRIMTELKKSQPTELVKGTPIGFGGKYPDNDAPAYIWPALFATMIAFASAPAFLYWAGS